MSDKPQTFRKKPVEIQAMQIEDDLNQVEKVQAWIYENGGVSSAPFLPDTNRVISVQTLEGEMWAGLGDWIIRGVKGEFYPCKPDIFEATYDAVGPR